MHLTTQRLEFVERLHGVVEGRLAELPKRTEALHGLLDTHVGLSA